MARWGGGRGAAAWVALATASGVLAAVTVAAPACKPRQFNEGKAAGAHDASRVGGVWSAHPTSEQFSRSPIGGERDLAWAAAVAEAFVKDATGGAGP